jgi:hypothetical protein
MRSALAIGGVTLLALAATRADSQQPPAPTPPAFTVVSRVDNTQTVETGDMRLVLTKGKLQEHALVRRFIFITATLRLTEPTLAPEGDAPPAQTCRFAYRAFLQRQICFTSMSGLSSCTQPEIEPLPDEASGEAPAPANAQAGFCNDVFRPAATARVRLSSSLLSNAKALFAADQKGKVEPLMKASGVTARIEEAPARPAAPVSRP